MKLQLPERFKWGGMLIAFVLTIFGMGVPMASAHYVYQEGNMYESSEDCTHGRSEVSHGIGYGYSRTDIWVYKQLNGTWCEEGFTRPAGYIATDRQYYYWTGAAWAVCRDTGWIYSLYEGSYQNTNITFSSKPCGTRYYGTMANMFEYNGSWKGGPMWSGYHYL